MHYFALPWLKAAAQHLRRAAVYHIAHKQIPAKGGVKVPGLKLEMFIFDPFCTADKTTLLEVCVDTVCLWWWRGEGVFSMGTGDISIGCCID
jgi:hypothetical protein